MKMVKKLLYNPTKKEELQAVLPGQNVPVATHGIFTLSSAGYKGATSIYTVGKGIKLLLVLQIKVRSLVLCQLVLHHLVQSLVQVPLL